MDSTKVKSSLQDLIQRLLDAEKGYIEIINASSNVIINQWLDKYAKERHEMHKVLEGEVIKLGGHPDVHTTFLGELHRMFIDIKISNTSAENEFPAIVTEIKRGANVLINDYNKILQDVDLTPALATLLKSQKSLIEREVESLKSLEGELEKEYENI